MGPIRAPHNLARDEAKKAAARIADALQAEYGGSWKWVGDGVLQYQHHLIAGTLVIYPDTMELAVNLGPTLRLFSGKVYQKISREMTSKLEEAAE